MDFLLTIWALCAIIGFLMSIKEVTRPTERQAWILSLMGKHAKKWYVILSTVLGPLKIIIKLG